MNRQNESEYLVSDRFFMSRENRMRLIAKCKKVPDSLMQRKRKYWKNIAYTMINKTLEKMIQKVQQDLKDKKTAPNFRKKYKQHSNIKQ